MRLTPVVGEMLAFAWPDVEPWIAAALARAPNELTVHGLRDLCLRGEGVLVLIGEAGEAPVAAGVTQVRDYEDGDRRLWILALGGAGASTWRGTLRALEDGARAKGCTAVEFTGRPGWARLLPDYAHHIHYAKRLI